jgi:hypothetical protein
LTAGGVKAAVTACSCGRPRAADAFTITAANATTAHAIAAQGHRQS